MTSTAPPGAGAEPRPAAASSAAPERSAWIEDHLSAVYRYARRWLSDPDAHDAAAEAFAALFEAERRRGPPDDPAAYLFGVARRRVADRMRRRARGHEPAPLPAGWEGFCDAPLPPEAAADRELAEAVHVALGLLTRAERDLLWARHRDGVPLAGLAARLGLTEKAVEGRLHRAREALRRRLGAVGEAWADPAAGGEGGA